MLKMKQKIENGVDRRMISDISKTQFNHVTLNIRNVDMSACNWNVRSPNGITGDGKQQVIIS